VTAASSELTGSRQNRWRSEQVVATPRAFVRAVEMKLDWVFTFDLAATSANSVTGGYYFGPGSAWGEDALVQPWDGRGFCWLNPPFGDIGRWAEKCALERARGATIAMLTPASIGTDWFAAHVHGKALVLGIAPRLTFVGSPTPYPKDLMLSVFSPGVAPGFDVWRWK
jgi:hypothetical protein